MNNSLINAVSFVLGEPVEPSLLHLNLRGTRSEPRPMLSLRRDLSGFLTIHPSEDQQARRNFPESGLHRHFTSAKQQIYWYLAMEQ
jgi:hypothetical protein